MSVLFQGENHIELREREDGSSTAVNNHKKQPNKRRLRSQIEASTDESDTEIMITTV